MERQEGNDVVVRNEEQEVYVTNTAIKATDVLMAIGAGAFALGGIGLMINQFKNRKLLKEKQAFDERIIARLIAEGASEEEIKNAKEILAKCI